jgi:hypothetical protein
VQRVDGAKLNQALVWNVRTCRSDAKGEVSSGRWPTDEKIRLVEETMQPERSAGGHSHLA